MPPTLDRLRYRVAELGATLIGRLPLNQVTLVVTSGQQAYRKRRRWYAPLLIACARITRTRFVVLSGAEWIAWERAVYQQLYGEQIRDTGGALELPARPGQPLAHLLATTPDATRAIGAVATALRELATIHQHVIVLPGRASRPFSHGDATAANVTYLERTARAWWFDFETAHQPGHPHASRCADDIRALLFSSAAILGEPSIEALARVPIMHYPSPAVLAALRDCMQGLLGHPDPLHIAQTRTGYQLNRSLALAILRELEGASIHVAYKSDGSHTG